MVAPYLKFDEAQETSTWVEEIGRSSIIFRPPKTKRETDMWKSFLQLVPECEGFGWPNKDGETELRSFRLQASKHVDTVEPDWRSRFPLLEEAYVRHDLPEYLRSQDDNLTMSRLRSLVNFLNMDASPGVPYALIATSNRMLFDMRGDQILEITADRLKRLLEVPLHELQDMSSKERYARGLVDPVRIFVKDEPHDVDKLREGRVRLIMSVSIVDKLIQMYLRKHIHDVEIDNWRTIPSKPGISFNKSGVDEIYRQGRKLDVSSDLSGYDWSYPEWMKLADVEFKIHMCNNPSKMWIHLMHASRICLSDVIYQTSHGKLLRLQFSGNMNSGEYITGNCNSFTRVLAASIVGGFPAIAMGDDCLESYVADAKEKYASMGLRLKVYDPIGERFEFCSRIYTKEKSWLVRLGKVMMNAFHTDTSTLLLFKQIDASLQEDLADHPSWDKVYQAMREVGFYDRKFLDEKEVIWLEGPNIHNGDHSSTSA